jgi:hypothetical protein
MDATLFEKFSIQQKGILMEALSTYVEDRLNEADYKNQTDPIIHDEVKMASEMLALLEED